MNTPDVKELEREAQRSLEHAQFARAALSCRQALRADPTSPQALRILGSVHGTRGDHKESERLLAQALRRSPDDPRILTELAATYRKTNQNARAVECLTRAIALQPNFFAAYSKLADVYYHLGKYDDLKTLYRTWEQQDPGNVEITHMLAAVSGVQAPERCSVDYVQTHFDKLAASFDERLVDCLEYRGHQIAIQALRQRLTALSLSGVKDLLDLGCGTGLCGPLLRGLAQKLVGVDLSVKMLEQARVRNCYDDLIQAEICSFLRTQTAAFDTIVSSDVWIYLGALEELVHLAYQALRSEGILVVTMEAAPEPEIDKFRLEVHGRYTHSPSYVKRLLGEIGFVDISTTLEKIRRENNDEVVGLIVTAQKISAP